MNYDIQLRQRRRRRWPVVLAAVVIVAAVGAAYLIVDRGLFSFDESRVTNHESRLYHCPMHPTYTSDRPGECPICGMNLVPVEKETDDTMGAHGHGAAAAANEPPGRAAIRVTDTQRQMIGVKTAAAVIQPLTKEIRTVGTVAFDPNLAVAQKEYLTARSLGDRTLADAGAQRLQIMGMSPEQIKQLAKSGRVQKNLYLIAPSGTAWIYAAIYEVDIPFINVGQMMGVRIPGDDGSLLGGTIAAIDPVLDQKTRTVRVRSEVKDPARMLKPNQYVDVFLKIPLGDALTIPSSALLWSEKTSYVFVDEGGGKLMPREVTVGGRTADAVQIIAGLEEGEQVVTSANFLIDAESQLKATLEEMGGAKGHGGHTP